jgi:hypothetical protein
MGISCLGCIEADKGSALGYARRMLSGSGC